ncbi:MAG TPA: fibronectin type III domain-containing protein [Gemmatimonadaceae bacterium]|nr:fibronectin type III domain-containing protein [Gemmatimonadaceae bacterium]
MRISRVFAAVVAVALTVACGSDSLTDPGPEPVLGLAATPKGATSIQLSFTGTAGDASYSVERAAGAAGTFAAAGTVPAPATGGTVTWEDTGLSASTLYRYRVITVRGGGSSAASGEISATTLAFGTKAATINADIAANRTLYADTAYTISGFVHVLNGATLTIEPGTIIKGDYNVLGSSLMIMRGAKINAIGTAAAPIVFTSSRAVGQRQPGDWGGLIIVGNAPDNRSGAVNIEGSGTDGAAVVSGKNYPVQYSGGTLATDNSGTLAYVRVEFSGFAPIQDQEFNSFTFAAVGSGTRASYLESLAGLDDSFEFFGGGFDLDHLVAFETADDVLDMSEGFSGRIQFVVAQATTQLVPRTGAGFYSIDLQGIENDGCNGTGCDLGFNSAPLTMPLVANFTLIGCGQASCVGSGGGHGLMLRRGTGGYYVNGVIARWPSDGVSLRDAATYARAGSVTTPAATADLQLKNIVFAETNGKVFQANTATPATQFDLDLAANNLTLSAATAASLFASIPAVAATPTSINDFDFTPAANSPIATAGLATFTGAIATKAGTFVTATPYAGGAAPGGPKWWQGWTSYARN